MCFSTEASLTAAAVLIPAGVYTVAVAWRKERAYLPLAALPLLFGVQQCFEAAVWWGLGHDRPDWVRAGAVGFLFFAIALWPGWVPFAAGRLETGRRRWLFDGLAVVGLATGLVAYLPAVVRYGEWLQVTQVEHSIRYDFTRLPWANSAAGVVWLAAYMAAVCCPLLVSGHRPVRGFGLVVVAAAVVTHLQFRYAFVSVWCFLAALLSLALVYILLRLPAASDRRVLRPGVAPLASGGQSHSTAVGRIGEQGDRHLLRSHRVAATRSA